MEAISHYCKGYSHIASGKPCQDCAYAESSEKLSMAIVSDGHGGDRYFRSDRGSKILVEITAEAIRQFTEFGGGYGDIDLATSENLEDGNFGYEVVNEKLRWLFSYIIAQWNTAIEKDVKDNPLTDWEKEHVDEKYLNEFRNADTHEKTYGCTLMAYFQISTYWAAFQIGDGKLLTMTMKGGKPVFAQPVPWDEKCFLNKTTSICDSNAIDEFRYCYCSNGTYPDAVFLGSDGLDDTYGDGALLEDFYMNVYLEIAKGKEKALTVLKKDLPEISKRGSKDDMSVAVVYDDVDIVEKAVNIIDYQVSVAEQRKQEVICKITSLEEMLANNADKNLSEDERIRLEYAKKDLAKLTNTLQSLESRIKRLWGRKGFFIRLTKNNN